MAVITPEINSFNQMIFRDNIQKQVWNKNVLLLVASITTGKTVNRALDCVRYYGGKTAGICALFTHVDSVQDITVNGLFDSKDIPKYETTAATTAPFSARTAAKSTPSSTATGIPSCNSHKKQVAQAGAIRPVLF